MELRGVNLLAQGCLSFSNSWHSTSQPLKPQMCAHLSHVHISLLPSGQAVLQTSAAPRIKPARDIKCLLLSHES